MEKTKHIRDANIAPITDGSDDCKKTLEMLQNEHNFECIEALDKGVFGSVFEVRHPEKDEKLAVKISTASKVSKGDRVIWSSLQNEHLVPLLASYYFKSTDTYTFVMNKYKTNLLKQIEDIRFRKDVKGFQRAISYLKDIVDGMIYLHSHGICHADLKTNNVLIDEKDKASICDFGFAQKPLLLIDNYGTPTIYCPPEAKQVRDGRALVNGFHLDMYTLGILVLEMFTHHSLIRTVAQKDSRKINWSSDVYPVLFELLQPDRFKVLVGTEHMTSNISSTSKQDVLNMIKSLVCLDPSKRATLFEISKSRVFGGKMNKYCGEEIWKKKVTPDEVEKMIGLYAPNPLLTVENLLENRKAHAGCDDHDKSFEVGLNIDKSKKETLSESDSDEFEAKEEEKILDRGHSKPRQICNWIRRTTSWIGNLFASCRKRKSRK